MTDDPVKHVAEETIKMSTHLLVVDAMMKKIAQARIEGRKEGLREAAKADANLAELDFEGVWTAYEHGVNDMQRAILALIDTPAPAKSTVQEAQRYIHDLITSRMLPAKEGNAAIAALIGKEDKT